MTDIWNARASAYRESGTHASGDDLDLVVAWCEPAPGVNVLDVATGGGHVARRLREAGAKAVTVDAAPGMEPDVIAPADHLPFADSSFDGSRLPFTDLRFTTDEQHIEFTARGRRFVCDIAQYSCTKGEPLPSLTLADAIRIRNDERGDSAL